jgi:hypothetical protein
VKRLGHFTRKERTNSTLLGPSGRQQHKESSYKVDFDDVNSIRRNKSIKEKKPVRPPKSFSPVSQTSPPPRQPCRIARNNVSSVSSHHKLLSLGVTHLRNCVDGEGFPLFRHHILAHFHAGSELIPTFRRGH